MLKPLAWTSAALGVGLVAIGCSIPTDEVEPTAAATGEDQQALQQEEPYGVDETMLEDMQPWETGKESADDPGAPGDPVNTEAEPADDEKWRGGWRGGWGGWRGGWGGWRGGWGGWRGGWGGWRGGWGGWRGGWGGWRGGWGGWRGGWGGWGGWGW